MKTPSGTMCSELKASFPTSPRKMKSTKMKSSPWWRKPSNKNLEVMIRKSFLLRLSRKHTHDHLEYKTKAIIHTKATRKMNTYLLRNPAFGIPDFKRQVYCTKELLLLTAQLWSGNDESPTHRTERERETFMWVSSKVWNLHQSPRSSSSCFWLVYPSVQYNTVDALQGCPELPDQATDFDQNLNLNKRSLSTV